MPKLSGLRVVSSGIHGYGVIATRDFSPGEVVAEVDGVLWSCALEERDDRYSLSLDGDWMFDMVDQTRWINHSCAPNCEVDGEVDENGNAWANIVAIVPIRAGEEVTYDYAFEADVAEPCHCGAPACRGYIVDKEQLPRLQRRLNRSRVAR